ncbi:hypothetical protein XFF6990_200176 [Xanthomonas citri pv. fuscans]|nr:hypothetical protein XFF6990_200176 [Xanthomonas citri pv. fuscans]
MGIGESKNKGVVASLLESLSASQRAPPQNAAPPLPIPNTESRIPNPDSRLPTPRPTSARLRKPSAFMSLEPLGYCLSGTALLQSVSPLPIPFA